MLLLSRTVGGGGRGVAEVEFAQDGDDRVDVIGGGRRRGVALGRQWEPGPGGPAGRFRRGEFSSGQGVSLMDRRSGAIPRGVTPAIPGDPETKANGLR
ncbi:hypothetical protein SSPO_081940 [Streptomyces antimycoticus]|uniref:Uncharacterized protein n=1 Tax=Streptomyces antimycoticus TaxID=68175 RepID=A0A499VBA7_9ACTN|nr:hypothetical protein SSPO_081940 [Streptomyces antimycoticus]